jgi:hypothetical protein
MRMFVIVAFIVSSTMPAFSQGMPGGGRRQKSEQKTEEPKIKANEKDYKAALERLPVPARKYDPWQTMRPSNDKH